TFITGYTMLYTIFFFFQAEDGIRDGHVTGVQTCALPISAIIAEPLVHIDGSKHQWFSDDRWHDLIVLLDDATTEIYYAQLVEERSEERRVGKECRIRWSTYH